MNDMNSIIREDAQKRIAEYIEMAQDAESKIKHLEDVKVFAAQKIAEYGEALVELDKAEAEPTYAVQWFNTDNLTMDFSEGVQVHGAGCDHIAKLEKSSKVRAGYVTISEVEEWSSAQDFFDDYNADFYEEGGNDGCHAISYYPCTKMVSRFTTLTKMVE